MSSCSRILRRKMAIFAAAKMTSASVTGTWPGARRWHSCRSWRVGRWRIMACFTTRCLLTAPGSRRRTTVMSGSRCSCGILIGGPIPAAVGRAAIAAGPGFPKSPSAGRPIITAAGPCFVAAAGSGCRAPSGLHHGFHGVKMTATSAGPRFRRRPWLIVGIPGIPPWTSSSGSVRSGSILSKSVTSAARFTGTVCRFPAT